MSDWDPATEAETAMRDALLNSDQELYFRILARSDLLLPVSADALAGRAPLGWGTWTTGNRTHVLAFTSPAAMRVCLNDPTGSFRTVPFYTLAGDWPNYEWWLAVNPGLPIEAYLPSWFVTQLTRGDVRLPGRAPTQNAAPQAPAPQAPAPPAAANSGLASALQGRFRASAPAPAGASKQTSAPPGPPISPGANRASAPRYSNGPTYDGATGYNGAAGYEGAAEYDGETGYDRLPGYDEIPEYDATPGYAGTGYASTGYASTGYEGAPGYDVGYEPAARFGAATGYDARTSSNAGAAYVNGGSVPIETIEAEIIDHPPAPAPGPPSGSVPGPAYGPDSGPSSRATPTFERAATRDGTGMAAAAAFAGRAAAAGYSGSAQGTKVSFASQSFGSQSFATEPPTTSPTSTTSATNSSTKARKAARETHDAEIVSPSEAWAASFAPANETEANLLSAAEENNTDAFLSTLLLARVILPVPTGTPATARPRDDGFPWQIDEIDGQRFISVYTSLDRQKEHSRARLLPERSSVSLRFVQLIAAWPDDAVSFAINPGSPVGATLPGSQIVALASWAVDVGLRDEASADIAIAAKKHEATPVVGVAGAPTAGADRATVMQRTVPHSQVPFYLERGYDRVAGFVNRAAEVSHLTAPRMLYRALGLMYSGSPFGEDDADVHVLRWVAHRADLYRLPYGGQHEAGMRAMQGWVIERTPFRGNGFAPSDTDVVAEFKVDSVRLPHGAQMWRLAKDGTQTLVATFDADTVRWIRTGEVALRA